MHAVAIHGLRGDPADHVRVLAEVLGVTAYEARARVQVPGGGPSIVATYADAGQAQALGQRLRSAGLPALVCEDTLGDEVSAFEVRTFELGDAVLSATTREGRTTVIPWTDVDLLIRGVSSVRETKSETVKERKMSVGRALVSGGLILSKTKTTERTSTTTTSEAFVVVYSSGHGPLMLRDSTLAYQSLGPNMQPARAANFAYLIAELRRRATAATFDDRPMRRAAQQQMLGPTLEPEEHLDLAVALIALAHRGRPA